MSVSCGWDNPLQTYFYTVLRDPPLMEEDADPVVLWLGLAHREVQTSEEMSAPLSPYADLDAQTIRLLRADHGEDLDRSPTALQRRSLAAFRG